LRRGMKRGEKRMAASADCLAFLEDQLRGLGHVTSRRMFSGAGLYCDGVIFALVLRDTLYFKVDDANREAYQAERLAPFRYAARGRMVEIGAYWQVPDRLFDDPEEMVAWARAAVAAGQRAEARQKKRKQRGRRTRA
jgi:DNA transformation protein and related proteins